jgi:AcrR family transcriptional regulator
MIEPRMHAAALAVYAERGWYGLSLEAVARQAGVGQPATYLRWPSKAELLVEAVEAHAPELAAIDTGSAREDLLLLARHLVGSYRSPWGVVSLRLVLDARSHPELAERFGAVLHGPRARAARAVVDRWLERGRLRPTPSALVLELLSGAALSHVLFTPEPEEPGAGTTTRADERFVERLVDSLLVDGG